jgi:hypothetical protein
VFFSEYETIDKSVYPVSNCNTPSSEHFRIDDDCGIVGCNAMSSYRWLQTFRRKVAINYCLNFKIVTYITNFNKIFKII